ncbi:MAG: hypothetical protein ACW98Y_03670 [Candidatus Thorarchaeota archaeon]
MQRVTYCLECGIPLVKLEDFGGEDPDNRYCYQCTDEDGNLIRRSRIQDGIKDFWSEREDSRNRTKELCKDRRYDERWVHWRR